MWPAATLQINTNLLKVRDYIEHKCQCFRKQQICFLCWSLSSECHSKWRSSFKMCKMNAVTLTSWNNEKKKRKWKHLSRNTLLGFIFTVMDYPAPPVSKSVFKSLELKCQVASSNGRTAHCWHSWMLSGIMNSNTVARLGSVFRKTLWIWVIFIWKSAPFGIVLYCFYPQLVLWTKRLLVLHLSQTGQRLDDSETRPF